ncbi:stealth family protein [Lutibacter holmesii]|uniref:Stealth family protein n=1 Tax=Lutibacter holmesii TaxID=1137985 RepID=A0ABW3WPY0_9FLAO
MIENDKIQMPVDVVITWVDGEDEQHIKTMAPYISGDASSCKKFRTRFDQVDEIKFTVDSILKFAPFIRNIFIVTDNQIPAFLTSEKTKDKYANVSIVDHKEIFTGYEDFLPTFNCRPIETQLYKIPNLAEHFIYFNDDMFLIKPVKLTDFFINNVPVLRGKWLLFEEDRLVKKAKNLIKGSKKERKAGHKLAQQKGAKLAGFKKYYKFHHTPFPFRKSTFENYFSKNRNHELENVKHRFRTNKQFTPQSLINHIEIKNKTCVLKDDYQLIYIQSYKKPLLYYKMLLNKAQSNSNTLFICLQSLDQCSKNKLKYFENWSEKILKS